MCMCSRVCTRGPASGKRKRTKVDDPGWHGPFMVPGALGIAHVFLLRPKNDAMVAALPSRVTGAFLRSSLVCIP